MDRREIRRLLTATEEQIAHGEVLIQNQRWRIRQLERAGQDTAEAQETLQSFMRDRDLKDHHRAKLVKLLNEAPD